MSPEALLFLASLCVPVGFLLAAIAVLIWAEYR